MALLRKKKATELLVGELKFNSEAAEKTYYYLVKAFETDYLRHRMQMEKAGWRTLTEIARKAKVTAYSMYGRSGRGGKVTAELANLGLVESRFFLGERGRGGRIFKIRIRHRQEPVKQRLDSKDNNNTPINQKAD